MTEQKIPVIVIDADRPVQNVFLELCYNLKPFLEKRAEMIEKKLTSVIPEEQLKIYERSSVYKHSRFGKKCPSDLFSQNLQNCVLYRERIYYAKNEEV
jgi:hypothetical protein